MVIHVTDRFIKSYRRLPTSLQQQAKTKETIFSHNPFDARLHTHKLIGHNKECWSFSVNYSYRIKFIFLMEHEVLFLDIGTHDIYR